MVGSCAIGVNSLRASVRKPPWISPPSPCGSAVEDLAVEAMIIDIMEEVGGRDRRVAPVQGDDDLADAGLDRHRDQIFGRSGGFRGGRSCRSLRDQRRENAANSATARMRFDACGLAKAR